MTDQREKAWECSYEDARRRSLTRGLLASPSERVAWLEQVLRLAQQTGALERHRAQKNNGAFK